jgi:hypothetical protein
METCLSVTGKRCTRREVWFRTLPKNSLSDFSEKSLLYKLFGEFAFAVGMSDGIEKLRHRGLYARVSDESEPRTIVTEVFVVQEHQGQDRSRGDVGRLL